MSAQEATPFSLTPTLEPERALRLGASAAAAPLWAAYFAAAGAGMTYWWMTAWTRQAKFAFAETKTFAPALKAPAAKTVVELKAEVAALATPEPVLEPVVEAVAASMIEAAKVVETVVAETAKVDAPKAETVKAEAVKVEAPKAEPAKIVKAAAVEAKPAPKAVSAKAAPPKTVAAKAKAKPASRKS